MATKRAKRRLRLERIRKQANKLHHIWAACPDTTDYRGINYAGPFSSTNKHIETGIRFGVIPMHAVTQAWCDSSEGDYGDPHCPKCGNEAKDVGDIEEDVTNWRRRKGSCGDYGCEDCKLVFDAEDAFGDEPLAHILDDGEYRASRGGDDSDIFILMSPYYTRAQFCSPCAPGACYLLNPCPTGDKCYCFGHDWFEKGRAPYPVWSVKTGKLITK